MNPLPLIRRPAVGLALMLASTLLVVAGCETTHHESDEQMAVAEAAVQRASTTNTSENAATELRVATAKLASAFSITDFLVSAPETISALSTSESGFLRGA